ncbi:MAG TPA: hypothetical protein VKA34_01570 [Balneolales bacterium]|nr:hypothetical protein [Balneolales bacterium]
MRVNVRLYKFITILTGFIFLLSGCNSSRWIVQDKPAVDTSNGTIINSMDTIFANQDITPSNPILTLKLMQINKVQYPKRLVVERYIQRYRPRYGYMALSLLGSAFLFYTANSKTLTNSKNSKNIMNIAGGLLGISSFLNLKPVGKPKPTGESQLSKKTGSVVRVDTVWNQITTKKAATISIHYKGRTFMDNVPAQFKNGKIDIDLAHNFKIGDVKSATPGSLDVRVSFQKKEYQFPIPLTKFMKRYAVVIRPSALLHSAPADHEANVLTNVKYNSQLPYVDQVDSTWFKVLYGITPTYLKNSDADLVWKTTSSVSTPKITISPYSEFGNIDVEQNIPVNPKKNPAAVAILMDNSFNPDINDPNNQIYNRDIELMKEYLIKTLGYSKDRIFTFNQKNKQALWNVLGFDVNKGTISHLIKPDSSDVFFYYTGDKIHLSAEPSKTSYAQDSTEYVTIYQSLINSIAKYKAKNTFLIFDSDFVKKGSNASYFDENSDSNSIKRAIFELAQKVASKHSNMVVIFSSDIDQEAGFYKSSDGSVDKKHSIFTYYFCEGLKERNFDLLSLSRYLQRNVTFTSRSLLDKAQDPVFYGNLDLKLTSNFK